MSRDDAMLVWGLGIVTTFLFLIAILITLGYSQTAAAWVQAVGSVGAIIAAIVVGQVQVRSVLRAERRAADERVRTVRVCIAAEIQMLLGGIKPLLACDTNDIGAPAALVTLGTLNLHVYQAMLPQLGTLKSELAASLIGSYANLDLLIQRGRQMERDLEKPGPHPDAEADARDWLASLQRVSETMTILLTELQSEKP